MRVIVPGARARGFAYLMIEINSVNIDHGDDSPL